MTDRAVHRVVQEALTNAAKHAPGAAVDVRVVRDNDTVTTTVRNLGPTGPSPGLASGHAGLVGLDERVRLAGGARLSGSETHSVLGSAAYAAISPGDSATEVQTKVPSVSYEVGPRDMKRPGCVYHRVRQFAATPV